MGIFFTILGTILLSWWTIGRWVILKNETWFNEPHNIIHATMMGMFLLWSLCGIDSLKNIAILQLSGWFVLRIGYAIMCDFQEGFANHWQLKNYLYTAIDILSFSYVSYILIVVAYLVFSPKQNNIIAQYVPVLF